MRRASHWRIILMRRLDSVQIWTLITTIGCILPPYVPEMEITGILHKDLSQLCNENELNIQDVCSI